MRFACASFTFSYSRPTSKELGLTLVHVHVGNYVILAATL